MGSTSYFRTELLSRSQRTAAQRTSDRPLTDRSLSDYAGQVVLCVNVASQCGLTPQYTKLQALQQTYAERGFSVLGFPCNQFKGQEPGTAEEIRTFCDSNYGVTFPLFAKLDVNGKKRHPLYAWLTSEASDPEGPGDVQWNFGKFLINKEGAVIGRFEPMTEPDAPELIKRLEAAL